MKGIGERRNGMWRTKHVRNINEKFGESITFETVDEMEQAIKACGYELPHDGLIEGRDYEEME